MCKLLDVLAYQLDLILFLNTAEWMKKKKISHRQLGPLQGAYGALNWKTFLCSCVS